MNWEAVYASAWQALWALWVAPLAFLLFRGGAAWRLRGAEPQTAFVALYGLGFALETLIDPFCTTFLVSRWGWGGTPHATATGLLFVLLGDFRVFLLVFGLEWVAGVGGVGRAIGRSAALTAAVPVAAYAIYGAGDAATATPLEGRWLWLAHEGLFVVLALGLRAFFLRCAHNGSVERRRFIADALLYSAVYYALWASADVLILAGWDGGFALRILPNQLYYAFWIPFVWWRYHRGETSLRGERV